MTLLGHDIYGGTLGIIGLGRIGVASLESERFRDETAIL